MPTLEQLARQNIVEWLKQCDWVVQSRVERNFGVMQSLVWTDEYNMTHDPQKHHRQSIRLRQYDYAWPGAYFVTICVREKECVLGDIVDGEMRLSEFGRIVAEVWSWLAKQYSYVGLDEWVIMPNHIHGILALSIDERRGGSRSAPTGRQKPLGQLIGAFKTVSTKRINALRGTPGVPFWQRNYWEHVIRDDLDLNRIRHYIENNPRRWHEDQLNPLIPARSSSSAKLPRI